MLCRVKTLGALMVHSLRASETRKASHYSLRCPDRTIEANHAMV